MSNYDSEIIRVSKLESDLAAARAEKDALKRELMAVGTYAMSMAMDHPQSARAAQSLIHIANTCTQALRQPATGGE